MKLGNVKQQGDHHNHVTHAAFVQCLSLSLSTILFSYTKLIRNFNKVLSRTTRIRTDLFQGQDSNEKENWSIK